MSTPTPAVTASRSRFLRLEDFAALATVSAIGLAWWMGEAGMPRESRSACPSGDRVNSAHADEAAGRVRAAVQKAGYTAMGGSPYVAAKLGLPHGSPEHRLAQAAAAELAAARQDLARACALAGS